MTESIISRVEDKIDDLTKDVTKVRVGIAKMEEHLKTLNGNVKEQKAFCGTTTQAIKGRLRFIEQKIWLAYGGILVIGLLATTKSIGLW